MVRVDTFHGDRKHTIWFESGWCKEDVLDLDFQEPEQKQEGE